MKIYQINMKCSQLEEMKSYYIDILEMDLVGESESHFSVMAGTTKLVFEKDSITPFYHVCFRTNATFFHHMFNKLNAEKVLLPNEDGEISLFWKGKQAYFKDPDGNILEMLERPFTEANQAEPLSWFDVGEIGLPTANVKELQNQLNQILTDQVKADSDTFVFYGDLEGVFVIVKEGRHWYPTTLGATIHPLKVYVTGNEDTYYKNEIYPYEIFVRKEWNHELPAVQFRMARPTNQLEKLVEFYKDGIGLNIIGEFRGHEGYDGMMLGLPGHPYHIEFTQYEKEVTLPTPTKEHLLVFYLANRYKRDEIVNRLSRMGYEQVKPENPYWGRGGVTIEDPDGWRVVLMNSVGI